MSEVILWFKDPGTVIELRDKNRKIVGAVYTDRVDPQQLILSKSNTDELYYLYNNGVGIYFSYWVKLK